MTNHPSGATLIVQVLIFPSTDAKAQAHRAYFSEVQLVARQSKAALWIGKRVVAMLSFEARKARRLPCLDAPKERVKGFARGAKHLAGFGCKAYRGQVLPS
jgi:hypothetical protein